MVDNNYVQYNLAGFRHFALTQNVKYKVQNNAYIEAIQLDDSLTKMIIYLKDDVNYADKASDIDLFVNQIVFNLITKTAAEIDHPVWYVEGVCKDGKIKLNESISFREEITIFRSYDAEGIYSIATNSPTAIGKHKEIYERILSVLQNENLVVQFMTLYQILLENTSILAGAKSVRDYGQSKVVHFLKEHEKKYPYVKFQPSRDPRKKGKEEDTFTYIRNEIGHCEEMNDLIAYKQAGKQVTSDLIKKILIVLNDVLMLL